MACLFNNLIRYCSGAIGMDREAEMGSRKKMSDLDILLLSAFLIWIMLAVLLYLIFDLPRRLYEDIKKRLKAEIQSYMEKKKK